MHTKRWMAMIALGLLVASGCSSGDPVSDEAPTEGEMAEEAQEQQEEMEASEVATDGADHEDELRQLLQEVAAGDHRDEEERARDVYRNPVETLLFFGFDPNQNVLEIWPGGGWYTKILAPAIARSEGQLTVANFEIDEDDPESYLTQVGMAYLELLEEHREEFGEVEVGTLALPDTVEMAPPESQDMVLTFRSLHNQHRQGHLDDLMEAFYDVLRPGGTLGVVQHRAPEGSDPDETAPDGYLPEAFVIEMAEAAGFELVESSEINANPEDTADHEDGVWSLPPSLRGGEETAEEMEAIGESDRMTLRFVKR